MATPMGRERLRLAPAYASAAARYWLSVFPRVQQEANHWRGRAEIISDPTLRQLAFEAQRLKRTNLEGSAAFASFVPRERRGAVVRAQVAFQSIYDYTDTLAEQPSSEPVANGRQLHLALLAALRPNVDHPDYYAYQSGEDGGYLKEIVQACHAGLNGLPSYESIATVAHRLCKRIVCYQSLNLAEHQGGQLGLARWAGSATPQGSGLRWWETAASAGSSLGVFALMAAAARPGLSLKEAVAIERAYWPWAGALHSLLDSLADEDEDAAAGQRNLLDYYDSPQEAADRLALLAYESLRRTSSLADSRHHAIVLAGMVGSYASMEPRSERARLVSRAVLAKMGELARPTAMIFRCRRAVKQLA